MTEPFEILEHTADIGFRVWGAAPAELFENSASAMMDIMAETELIEPAETINVEVQGENYESLLVNWLSEVLYLFDADRFAASSFEIDSIDARSLRARLIGQARQPGRHPWKLIVKAVTYHQLKVAESGGRWEAQVFLDI